MKPQNKYLVEAPTTGLRDRMSSPKKGFNPYLHEHAVWELPEYDFNRVKASFRKAKKAWKKTYAFSRK